jgi:cytochrome c-type biogenesis protein CcmH/NrfF
MAQVNLVREFFQYLGKNKKLWLIPIAIILLLIGIVAVFSQSQGIAPFLYSQP